MQLDVLVIAPHPDDAELGMGGTIQRLLADGKAVGVLDLTNGEPTPYGSEEKRAAETKCATMVLRIPWRKNLGLPNRFLEADLEARAKLAGVIRSTKPKWLFAPYWVDAHPDHVAATQLVEAARFWAKLTKTEMPGDPHHPERIYNYYCVHLKLNPQPAFVVDITPFLDSKLESLQCYHSQFVEGRESVVPSMIDRARTEAAYWGQMIGVQYGEPFTCREPIGLNDLNSLI